MHYPRPRMLETDEAGSLISISDMMAGLLFVFIITLAAFIIRFQDAVEIQSKINEELTSTEKQRAGLLDEIKRKLAERGVIVEVDHEHGVLRLKESAIQFDVGLATLAPVAVENLQVVGEVMAHVLPCYTGAEQRSAFSTVCDSNITAKLDSILIEGHTDNVPIFNNLFKSNWELSTQRAIETYLVLNEAQPELLSLNNTKEQSLFSVSGYGAGRPVREHTLPTPDPENRRIDFRFIMSPPKVVAPQRQVQDEGLN